MTELTLDCNSLVRCDSALSSALRQYRRSVLPVEVEEIRLEGDKTMKLQDPITNAQTMSRSILRLNVAEERWILHGWLTDPWVHELRTCWRKNHRTHVGRACVVDLNEVTFIDKSGERLLCKLAKEGAQFTASGTYTKHILEHLNVLRKRNSWNLLGFLMVLVFVTVLGAGCERRVASAAAPPAPTVEVTPVIQKDVPVQGEWVGTLEGYVNAQISPQVNGYLIRQNYHEGALVKKGQVLFEIDPRPFQAVLDQAKGQLAQAEAQMANAELNVKRDIPEAEAHAIPQSQLDTDTQSLRGAKAAVEASQASVEQAELNLGD